MKKDYKISIIGAGYVGMSLACLFSRYYKTIIYDIDKERIDKINKLESPVKDSYIEEYLFYDQLNLMATYNFNDVLDSDFIVICTPTNYDESTNQFDCSSVEKTIENLQQTNATIVIKSTVPIGFTRNMREKYNTDRILFSPEFLREGKALYDNLYPSRIVVSHGKGSKEFSRILLKCSEKKPTVIATGCDEAESIKLFSNTYLAMRVAFFNELDSFALDNGLDTKGIINGVCLDRRIGNGYNNPSFGYGGYCLPKDTKQLAHDCCMTFNNDLIYAIIKSNESRKTNIVGKILDTFKGHTNKVIGIYRLIMKSGSDNFRQSAVLDIMNKLIDCGYKVVVYEPTIKEFNKACLCNNLEEFKNGCDLIVANRVDENLNDVMDKVFTRDLFGEN